MWAEMLQHAIVDNVQICPMLNSIYMILLLLHGLYDLWLLNGVTWNHKTSFNNSNLRWHLRLTDGRMEPVAPHSEALTAMNSKYVGKPSNGMTAAVDELLMKKVVNRTARQLRNWGTCTFPYNILMRQILLALKHGLITWNGRDCHGDDYITEVRKPYYEDGWKIGGKNMWIEAWSGQRKYRHARESQYPSSLYIL